MQTIKKNIVLVIVAMLAIASIVFAILFSNTPYNETNYYNLNDKWHIEINGDSYDDVSLKEFLFPVLNKGDIFRMSCRISPDSLIENPIFLAYTVHSDIQMYYNGELLYEYGQDLYDSAKILGYGYHFIHLPDNYAGAEIELLMRVSEDDAFSSIQIPQISNSSTVFRDFIIRNRVPLAVNMFLIVFGILLLFLSIIFCFYNKRFFRLVCIGAFSLGIGCWSVCNYDLISFFSYDLQMKAYIEFAALYISPLFVFLYFWNDNFVTRSKIVKNIYLILLTAQAVFVATAFILQLTNTVHFPAVLKIQHLLLLFLCLGFISLTLFDIIKRQLQNKTLVLGMASLIAIGLFDMIQYSVMKYMVATGEANFTSNLCVGALLFVLAQLVDFYTEITDILLKGAKAQMLEQIAYVDSLTGIANRRQCEIIWDELDKNPKNYGIFSFDLNNLKITNDTNGHPAGDFLLSTFANILSSVFGKFGTVGRFGGDEFLVILPNLDGLDITELTNQLEQEIDLANRNNPELNLSTAYGFCSHNEYPSYDARIIYRLADELMYQHKVSLKAEEINQ